MILNMVDYLIILPLVFFAGFIDAIAGGGGLISLPAYLSIGLPPHTALGTNKFSSCCGTIVSTTNYYRHGSIDLPVALSGAICALVGSWLGTLTVLLIKPDFLNYVLLVLIPAIAVLTIFRRDYGSKDISHNSILSRRIVLGCLAGLSIGFYDGFFGPGTGTFLIVFYVSILGYDMIRANGNTKVLNLASNVAAVISFAFAGKILYQLALPCAIAGIIGNHLGSKMAILRGNKLIKPVMLIVFILLFVKMVTNLVYKL